MISKTMSISMSISQTISMSIVTIVSISLRLSLSLSLVQPGSMLERVSTGVELTDSISRSKVTQTVNVVVEDTSSVTISIAIESISISFRSSQSGHGQERGDQELLHIDDTTH